MNVMLTRAKKGMVIVTCSSFIRSGDGARTLLGRLARYWETREGELWIDWRRVVDGTANLPGSPGTPSLVRLGWRSPVPHSSTFSRATAVPAPEKLAVRTYTIAARTADTEEKWRRPGIRESNFSPLASTSAFVHVGSPCTARIRLKHGPSVRHRRVLGAPAIQPHRRYRRPHLFTERRIRKFIQYPT
ncbi:hypothetical protein B0H13DRAFT_1060869 [Mycena leptocephala]|nr:hypothetical protein B0H13DRAFT_1060869 [Mycena leptocephala]